MKNLRWSASESNWCIPLRIIMRTDSSPLVVTWSPVVYQPLTILLYDTSNSTTLPTLQGDSWVTFFHPFSKRCTRCNHWLCGFPSFAGVRKVSVFEIHYINYLQKNFFNLKSITFFTLLAETVEISTFFGVTFLSKNSPFFCKVRHCITHKMLS